MNDEDKLRIQGVYGSQHSITEPQSQKNPNRVSGGLRGSGSSHYFMMDENGNEQQIPTQKYVESLESRIKMHQDTITQMSRQIKTQKQSLTRLESQVSMISSKMRHAR